MSPAALASAIGPMLALVLVGALLRRAGLVRREDAGVLNAVIIHVALPALIFSVVGTARLSIGLLASSAVAWVATLAALGIAWLVTRAWRLPRPVAGGFIIAAAIGNTGYIGYPVVRAVLGASALPGAIFYDVFGSIAVMLTAGIAVAARYGTREGERVDVVRELVTFPAVLALLAALAFRLVPWPEAVSATVMSWTGLAGSMAAPLIMISLGVSLDLSAFRGAGARIAAVALLKLLVLPAIAAGVALAMGQGASLRMVVIEAGMPTALLALIVAQRFGLDAEFVAAASVTTTVACVLTVPAIQLLLG